METLSVKLNQLEFCGSSTLNHNTYENIYNYVFECFVTDWTFGQ